MQDDVTVRGDVSASQLESDITISNDSRKQQRIGLDKAQKIS